MFSKSFQLNLQNILYMYVKCGDLNIFIVMCVEELKWDRFSQATISCGTSISFQLNYICRDFF